MSLKHSQNNLVTTHIRDESNNGGTIAGSTQDKAHNGTSNPLRIPLKSHLLSNSILAVIS